MGDPIEQEILRLRALDALDAVERKVIHLRSEWEAMAFPNEGAWHLQRSAEELSRVALHLAERFKDGRGDVTDG